ncbi:hypothetical protein TESG_08185 [Trichophyton tonsurans CBS 112818]|uniref:Uncharacterized protein n=1 Tax=Trichophyton tonsurans (strain CBS 112818) TaxID=647933 RepID=F2SBF3_TRIT1|nr:hypothetical protein TESG_08185 [Trichophyton tonsurans CBS 112818]
MVQVNRSRMEHRPKKGEKIGYTNASPAWKKAAPLVTQLDKLTDPAARLPIFKIKAAKKTRPPAFTTTIAARKLLRNVDPKGPSIAGPTIPHIVEVIAAADKVDSIADRVHSSRLPTGQLSRSSRVQSSCQPQLKPNSVSTVLRWLWRSLGMLSGQRQPWPARSQP